MKSNWRFLIFYTAILSGLCISCSSSEERVSLSFQDPIIEVADSLRIMRNFIWNLSEYLDRESGYYIDKGRFHNDFFIEGEKILNVQDLRGVLLEPSSNKDTAFFDCTNSEITDFLSDKTLARFLALSVYLDDNYISSGYIDKYFNMVVFGYKDTLLNDDQDTRKVTLIEEIEDTSIFFNEVRIYERKNNLVLFSPYK